MHDHEQSRSFMEGGVCPTIRAALLGAAAVAVFDVVAADASRKLSLSCGFAALVMARPRAVGKLEPTTRRPWEDDLEGS